MCNWVHRWYRNEKFTADEIIEAFHQMVVDGLVNR
jgi:hypothetical protein